MIKRILILAIVRLLSAALSVGAASVTPSSASDYIFTTPLFPDSIRGEVIGDPPAYFDPRGEDIDWLFEAFMERHALINGRMWDPLTHTKPSFGEWPLSDTNNFYRWSTAVNASCATNIVVGYNLVTNAPRFSIGNQDVKLAYELLSEEFFGLNKLGFQTGQYNGYRNYYLGDAPLIGGPRVAHDYYDSPMFTNVNHSIRTTLQTVTNVNYVMMPMTNGTTSVFTNRWTATYYHLVTNSITNVIAAFAIDYCHAGDGPFPGFPNETAFEHGLRGRRDGDLSVMYDALRCATRLAETTAFTGRTQRVIFTRSKYSDDNGSIISSDSYTNETYSASYAFSADGTDGYGWNSDNQEYDRYDDFWVSEDVATPYEAVAKTRFKSDIVTAGGTVRVEIEAAFAVVELSFAKWVSDWNPPSSDSTLKESVHKLVVVPLSSYTLDTSTQEALARVYIDIKYLSREAVKVSGAPNIPENPAVYEPPDDEVIFWRAECPSIVLIYRTHPSSKFSSW